MLKLLASSASYKRSRDLLNICLFKKYFFSTQSVLNSSDKLIKRDKALAAK